MGLRRKGGAADGGVPCPNCQGSGTRNEPVLTEVPTGNGKYEIRATATAVPCGNCSGTGMLYGRSK